MKDRNSYQAWLKQDFNSVIETLDLSDSQKHFLRSRWLENVLWMEKKANGTRTWHYILRLAAIIGGVIVPALIGLNPTDKDAFNGLRMLTFVISLLVAICVAVEEFFHFGERWRHYRRTVELLKVNGWQFFQFSGPYQQFPDHKSAYPVFAGKVEETMQNEVDVYIAEVMKEKKEEKKKD